MLLNTLPPETTQPPLRATALACAPTVFVQRDGQIPLLQPLYISPYSPAALPTPLHSVNQQQDVQGVNTPVETSQ
jgi:hypothetical protein